MRYVAVVVAACGLALGCGGPSESPAGPPEPAPPSFVLSGTVRDQGGVAIVGAKVSVVGALRTNVLTDESGSYRIPGLRDYVGVLVWKDWYTSQARELTMGSNSTLDLTLVKLDYDQAIVLGKTIHTYVAGEAPSCDPNWDARALCRRFVIVPPAAGRLQITINWNNGVPLDAMITTPSESYLAFSEEVGPGVMVVVAYVVAGVAYELRVNAYYESQEFNLTAVFVPDPA